MTDAIPSDNSIDPPNKTFTIKKLMPQPLNTLHLTERVVKEIKKERFKDLLKFFKKCKRTPIKNSVGHGRCPSCDRFEKRLYESLDRIRRRLLDKETNNPYFLILYELPYIFLDGKIIAGFDPNPTKKNDKSTSNVEEAKSFHCKFDDSVKQKILTDMGFVKIDKKKGNNITTNGFYTYMDEVNMWHITIPVSDYILHIFFASNIYTKSKKDKININNECIFQRKYFLRKSDLQSILSTEDYIKGAFKPSCLEIKVNEHISDKEYSKETVKYKSIEDYLFDRAYLDKALENMSETIWSKMHDSPNDYDPFRVVFLRTKRPDVNYLVIPVTPKMIVNINEYIGKLGLPEVKKHIKSIYKEFNDYVKKINSLESLELRDICLKRAKNLLTHLTSGNKITFEDIKDKFDSAGVGKSVSKQKINADLYKVILTVLYVSAMEFTPLAAGVGYNSGKRGVVDYSVYWHDHPFNNYKMERYPNYLKMVDKFILKSGEYSHRIDVPLVLNGKLFGILNMYPMDSVFQEEGKLDDVISKALNAIEMYQPDIIRAYFLDVCANVTDILGDIREENATLDELIKDVEDLIRYTHGLPRTYILTEDGVNRKDGIANKLADIFGCISPCNKNDEEKNHIKGICTSCKVFQDKIDSFLVKKDTLIEEWYKGEPFSIDVKNLPPNLRERIEKGEENLFSSTWYPTLKSIILKKRRAVVIQLHAKSPDQRSLREDINATYLKEAIETGLRAYEKKEEIIQHGTRAAVAAIMGRNMSHNIGSHVLSYLSEQSIKAAVEENGAYLSIDSPTSNRAIRLNGDYTFGFYKYLQGRSDYIAEISTAKPTWSTQMGLITDIIKPFVYSKYDKNEGRGELLDNIGKSIYYEKKRGKIFLDASMIKIQVIKKDISKEYEFEYDYNNGFSSLMDKCGDGFHEEMDTVVDIPHGILGGHAFYSIMENFIRNGMKHNSKEIIKLLKCKTKFTVSIHIETCKKSDDLIYIRLTDNVSKYSEGIKQEINKYITGESRFFVKNDGTLIRGGGWGIKEMRISAAWLRNIAPETLQYDNDPKDFPILKVDQLEEMLCYEFYMLKPLNVLFVGFEDVKNNPNIGIYCVNNIEQLKELLTKGKLRHKFVVFHQDYIGWIKEEEIKGKINRLKLPERIFLVINDKTGDNADKGIALISKIEYKEIKKRFVEKNTMLVKEFDRYILEHPEFADKIPNNALIVMQIEGDEEFNNWARETARNVAEKDNPIVYVIITELKPVRSRIEKLKLELVA